MCGIGGAVFYRKVDGRLLEHMVLETEKRGQDAFGIVDVKVSGRIKTLKRPTTASKVLASPEWRQFVNGIEPEDFLIWNCRAQPLTEVGSFDERSVQPIIRDYHVISHNGVVANDEELIKQHKLEPITEIDSEVPFLLYQKFGDLLKAFKECSGGFAYLLYDIKRRCLHFIKDFKTMVVGETDELFFILSEERFVRTIFGDHAFPFWRQVESYTCGTYDVDKREFKFQELQTKLISQLPAQEDKVLVCSSGGIDSTTAAYVCKKLWHKDVVLCHIDHGQKSEEGERRAVKRIAVDLGVEFMFLDMKWLGALGHSVLTEKSLPVPKAKRQNLKSTICWTPARNLVMIASLMAVAEAKGAKYITAGWTLEEEGSYPDNSILFFQKFNELSDYGTLMRPKLVMPLERLMKTEIIQLGSYLEVPYNITYSCDNAPKDGKACGVCGACTLRRMAFEKAGVTDATRYASDYKKLYVAPWMKSKMRPPRHSVQEILKRLVND